MRGIFTALLGSLFPKKVKVRFIFENGRITKFYRENLQGMKVFLQRTSIFKILWLFKVIWRLMMDHLLIFSRPEMFDFNYLTAL